MPANKEGINLRICYAGIYPPTAPRDKVYLEELVRRGARLDICTDNSSGLKKYFKIFKMLRERRGRADLLWVGYLSPSVVIVAWLAGYRRIVYNALASSYEAYILDQAMYS